jgi:hypothetical protein
VVWGYRQRNLRLPVLLPALQNRHSDRIRAQRAVCGLSAEQHPAIPAGSRARRCGRDAGTATAGMRGLPSIDLITIKDSNEPFKLNGRWPVSMLPRTTRNACSPSRDHAPTAA